MSRFRVCVSFAGFAVMQTQFVMPADAGIQVGSAEVKR